VKYQSYYPMQLAVRAMFRIDTNYRAHANNRALNFLKKFTIDQLCTFKVSLYVKKRPSRAIDLTDFTAVGMYS
jgi:hypothetical protein